MHKESSVSPCIRLEFVYVSGNMRDNCLLQALRCRYDLLPSMYKTAYGTTYFRSGKLTTALYYMIALNVPAVS